jgi:hypothetical protein
MRAPIVIPSGWKRLPWGDVILPGAVLKFRMLVLQAMDPAASLSVA